MTDVLEPVTEREALIAMAGSISTITSHISDIRQDIVEIKEAATQTNGKVQVLWTDRTIWNWVLRVFVVGTPIAVVVSNYFTSR